MPFVSVLAVLLLASPRLTWAADAAGAPKRVWVQNTNEFRAAVRAAMPGTRVEVAPGEYAGGFFFEKLRGEKVLTAGPSQRLPLFD